MPDEPSGLIAVACFMVFGTVILTGVVVLLARWWM